MKSSTSLTLGLLICLIVGLTTTRAADPVLANYVPADGENHVGFRKTSISYEAADKSQRTRSVLIWYPTSTVAAQHNYRGQIGFVAADSPVSDGVHPVILFSHGFLGMPDQSIFLTEGLARRGYIVAAIGHADGLLAKREKPIPAPNFGDAKSWTEDKFRDRREDVVALLDYLQKESQQAGSAWNQHVDKTAIGIAGHSLGGYTALGLIGGWEKAKDKRIKAALALSPFAAPYLTQGNLADVRTPVMFQGGTLDWGITPLVPGVYQKLTGPKYNLVLKNETHFGWTNLIALGKTTTDAVSSGNAQLMLDYSVAFFDRHVRGQPNEKLLDEKNAKLSSYEFAK
ncbi:alpha/beta hydrolase family protein [Anatilimnocola floriformis]|uniref:alpha/beta hydrolase family protein n=1 Tax=Anatilimnocola floriformis TaxID=2948575 RepID=UPI0020C59111|nr:alpha/beta hydrolase fold domain-containing protein [Anatilimnocola floriformis]